MHPSTGWLVMMCVTSLEWRSAESARILGVFHSQGRSHFMLGERLMKGLAARGHRVTMVSPYPQRVPPPSYSDVPLNTTAGQLREKQRVFIDSLTENSVNNAWRLYDMGLKEADLAIQHGAFQELLQSNATFDLIILDFLANYFYLGLAHRFKAPIVLVASSGTNRVVHSFTQNPFPCSYVPNVLLPYSETMSFFQRIRNTLYFLLSDFVENFFVIPENRALLHKYFHQAPDLEELVANVSLILSNSHHSISPRPLVPILKEVAGLHVGASKPLPKDMKSFLDDAKHGAIYFSLGTNLMCSALPEEKLKSMLAVFSSLRQRVLWKCHSDNLTVNYDNVLMKNWFPQNDVLGHPNTKVFITHGGTLSIIEAVMNGVPVIGVPFFGDQQHNVANAQYAGYGLQIDFHTMNEDILRKTILELLQNPRYRKEAKRRSLLMQDRPLKPLESAVYWIEHVLRHGSGRHLRVKSMDLPWYQNMLLDVIAALISSLMLFIYLVYLFVVKIYVNNSDKKLNIKTDKIKSM